MALVTKIFLITLSSCSSYLFSSRSFIPHRSVTSSQRRVTEKIDSLFENLEENNALFDDLRSRLKGTSVYIVGMMGSGKSTVGDIFAKQLGYRFLDTDEISEFMVEMPIADFFAESPGNEEKFRDLEYQILMEMAQYTRVVISTGGGIVERNTNWGILRHGIVVFLDMKAEDIYSRLSQNEDQIAKRPLLRGDNPLQKLEELSARRREKYLQSDLRIEVNPLESPNKLAIRMAKELVKFISENKPLWQTWKAQRQANAVDAANKINPAAAAEATGANKGTIQYVNLSDIKSGKVKLPNMNNNNIIIPEGVPKEIPPNDPIVDDNNVPEAFQ